MNLTSYLRMKTAPNTRQAGPLCRRLAWSFATSAYERRADAAPTASWVFVKPTIRRTYLYTTTPMPGFVTSLNCGIAAILDPSILYRLTLIHSSSSSPVNLLRTTETSMISRKSHLSFSISISAWTMKPVLAIHKLQAIQRQLNVIFTDPLYQPILYPSI